MHVPLRTRPGSDVARSGVESTCAFRLVRESVEAERLDSLGLKGKQNPIAAYRLIAVGGRSEVALRLEAPLVGRQDTLAQLEWALERTVAEKGCRLVTVVGAPGIGKSRLAHEFVSRLGERATVLRGRCLPYGEGITFWPLAEMIKEAGGIREGDGPDEAVAKLAALLEPDEDARTIAETIASLTGLMETSGVVEEGFWAGGDSSRAWQLLGLSFFYSTMHTGRKRRSSS
jgi:hypothetical protein